MRALLDTTRLACTSNGPALRSMSCYSLCVVKTRHKVLQIIQGCARHMHRIKTGHVCHVWVLLPLWIMSQLFANHDSHVVSICLSVRCSQLMQPSVSSHKARCRQRGSQGRALQRLSSHRARQPWRCGMRGPKAGRIAAHRCPRARRLLLSHSIAVLPQSITRKLHPEGRQASCT